MLGAKNKREFGVNVAVVAKADYIPGWAEIIRVWWRMQRRRPFAPTRLYVPETAKRFPWWLSLLGLKIRKLRYTEVWVAKWDRRGPIGLEFQPAIFDLLQVLNADSLRGYRFVTDIEAIVQPEDLALFLRRRFRNFVESAYMLLRATEAYRRRFGGNDAPPAVLICDAGLFHDALAQLGARRSVEILAPQRSGAVNIGASESPLERFTVPQRGGIVRGGKPTISFDRVRSYELEPVVNGNISWIKHVGIPCRYITWSHAPFDGVPNTIRERLDIDFVQFSECSKDCIGSYWNANVDSEYAAWYPQWEKWWKTWRSRCFGIDLSLLDETWLFVARFCFWRAFYLSHNISISIGFEDFSYDKVPADIAANYVGCISISSQYAVEFYRSDILGSVSDIHFFFSFFNLRNELASGSRLKVAIEAGYHRDDAFSLAAVRSIELRERLRNNGVSFVICFFDENSHRDNRKWCSDRRCAEIYRELAERVRLDPSLGLIIKPKKPTTLWSRLGGVAAELRELIKTGRCVVLDQTENLFDILPCEAAGASDLVIGFSDGITASLEASLMGCRAVAFDFQKIGGASPLTEGDNPLLLFPNIESIFDAISRFRANDEKYLRLGTWGDLLGKMDPFRDGNASQRIGSFIGRLGSDAAEPGAAIKDTVAQYGEKWGKDRISIMRGVTSGAEERNFAASRQLKEGACVF